MDPLSGHSNDRACLRACFVSTGNADLIMSDVLHSTPSTREYLGASSSSVLI